MHVGVDEAGDQQPAVEPSDRLDGVLGPQRGKAAPGADDALAHQQRADLGQRVARVARERVARRIDDRPGVQGHVVTARVPRVSSSVVCSRAAATATAITAGSFPVMPGWPIGQVIRAIISGL